MRRGITIKERSIFDKFLDFLKLLYELIVLFFRTLMGEEPQVRSGGIDHRRQNVSMGSWG